MNTKPNSTKKNIYVISSVAALIIIAAAVYYISNEKTKDTVMVNTPDSLAEKAANPPKLDTFSAQDSGKPVYDEYEDGEEREEPYSLNAVITSNIKVAGKQLKFGDKVYLDDSKSTEKIAIFYLDNPMKHPNIPVYSADASYFIEDYRYDEFKKNFSLSPFMSLPSAVKKLLLSDNYSDGNSYAVTQNAERAKAAVCSGDFDGDGLLDYAVIMDNNEKQISRIKVFCANAATKAFYLAYAENYSDRIKINSFKKGSKIFMDSDHLVPSPLDGAILNGENAKLALVYNRGSQKFKTYYQETYNDD